MLNEILAKQAICELSYRYAALVDKREYDCVAELFVPNGSIISGDFTLYGRNAIRQSRLQLEKFQSTFHCVNNQIITLHGDKASAEIVCVANHLYQKESVQRKLDWGIRYLDSLIMDEGIWRYVERQLIIEWRQDLPLNF